MDALPEVVTGLIISMFDLPAYTLNNCYIDSQNSYAEFHDVHKKWLSSPKVMVTISVPFIDLVRPSIMMKLLVEKVSESSFLEQVFCRHDPSLATFDFLGRRPFFADSLNKAP